MLTNSTEPTNFPRTNDAFIACWTDILTPKWLRFRHLLSGNGQIHSEVAASRVNLMPGERVLDIGSGFGETCLEAARAVGDRGYVLGIDCTPAFVEVAVQERDAAQVPNVDYEIADIESHPLAAESFDVAYSRFGIMFCASAVRALRNAHRALRPDGRLFLIAWRRLAENPAWCDARDIALRFLPPPNDGAATCGPGPFSWGSPETDRAMLRAAGFASAEFEQHDAPICVGRSMEEAVDYALLVGPAGEIVREARDLGQAALPAIRAAVRNHYAPYQRADGSVWLGSSVWFISARKG